MVEADIQAFFDTIDHDWLMRMLEQRIEDKRFLRLIRKWLKAGVLDTDGQVLHPVTGTPQGGIVSPILANVYLLYVLHLWFHRVVRPHCRGEACLMRCPDNFVCAFQYQEDAERFYREVGERLGKFGLELSGEKTRVIPFSPHHDLGRTSFDFLGFEFRWGMDPKGRPHLKGRTSRKRLRDSLKRFTEWCKVKCRYRLKDLFRELNAKLRGYCNYYGVIGNDTGLNRFFRAAMRILFKWLNRRGQRRSYNWAGFRELLEQFQVERPRIVGRPKARRAALGA